MWVRAKSYSFWYLQINFEGDTLEARNIIKEREEEKKKDRQQKKTERRVKYHRRNRKRVQ